MKNLVVIQLLICSSLCAINTTEENSEQLSPKITTGFFDKLLQNKSVSRDEDMKKAQQYTNDKINFYKPKIRKKLITMRVGY